MKEIIITSIFIILTLQIKSQTFYAERYDIGVNVTSLISKVISAADDSEENPIGIYLRKKNDKAGVYLGLAVLSTGEEIFENNLFLGIKTNNFFGRLGFEKYKTLSSKFNLGYGLAIAASTAKEESKNFTANTNITIHNTAIGGGPVLRFEYKLNKLISFSTESSIIGSYNQKKTTFENITGSDILKSNGYMISTDIPSQLFINIHF